VTGGSSRARLTARNVAVKVRTVMVFDLLGDKDWSLLLIFLIFFRLHWRFT
jgi:hypothetical protein